MKHAKQVVLSATFAVSLLGFGAAMGNAVSAAQAGSDMPAGPGKDITVATCTKCHSITNVTSQHKDRDGWTATITKMVGYGATGTDEDFQAILDYVTKNYGLDSGAPAAAAAPAAAKIAVNTSTAAQLATSLALTDDEAKAVVDYREKNGPFKTIDDLKKVPGVDTKKFDAHASDLQF